MKELQKFNLADNIITGILDLVHNKGSTFMDACILYSEENNIEIESIAEYVKKSELIKCSLEQEAEELNYMKKTRRLPL